VQLTPKESLIVSCVTQGMKNKEIALRVGTTEQVVKNYLRKVYDKLGVADRLELALYCLNHHVVDNSKIPPLPTAAPAVNAAAAGASVSGSPAPSTSAPVTDPTSKSQ
jgi:DNA-binding CsgD family transcriptional regulator